VGSLLHYKWWKFGMWVYVLNLLLYLPFLISLTVFALLVLTPETKPCKWFIFFLYGNRKGYPHMEQMLKFGLPYHQIKSNIMGTSHLWGDMLMPTQPL